jgi:hypothetical protein
MESIGLSGASGTMIWTSLPGQPGKDRLQVDWVIPWKLASQIFQMIMAAETAPKVAPESMSGGKT